MNTRQVEAVSKLLRDAREVEPARVPSSTRARTIEALEAALAARARRRRRARRAWVVLAAAAVIAAAVGGALKLGESHESATRIGPKPSAPPAAVATEAPQHAVEHVELPQGIAMTDGSILQPGSRIVAPPRRRAVLSFSSGTQLAIDGGGDITVVEAGDVQRFLLSSGTIDAHVAKLHAGQRWLVTTPDAEVEVRGTAFEVSIVPPDPSCGGGTRTRVSVREGVVSVRAQGAEARVHPGEVWPAGCHHGAVLATAGATDSHPVLAVNPAPATAPAEITSPPATAGAANHSTLAEQNDAFARIVTLRQRGDMSGCAVEVDRFLARFPTSPLAESARVEQMRALRVADPVRAAAVAREYLGRYPAGFARAEAQSIASQGK